MRVTARLLVFLASFCVVSGAGATTWYVEQDGSGDFTIIQDAIDAAADGDTILIGPGRYDEFFNVEGPAWTRPAVAWIDKDDLTFIGEDSDATILGPAEYYDPPGEPAMIIGCSGNYRCTIRDVTIEGAYDGIYWWRAELDLSDCFLRNCEIGLHASRVGPVSVHNTRFDGRRSLSIGVFVSSAEGLVEISGCEFTGAGVGVGAVNSEVVLTDDEFACDIGIASQDGASVQAIGCVTTSNVDQAIDVASAAISVVDSYLYGRLFAVYARSHGSIIGSNCVIAGGQSTATVVISSESEASLNNCHILKEGDLAVRLQYFFGDLVEQDLTNNYWGTTDLDSIAEWIWDGNDDPEIHSIVNYLPLADGPVTTENKSWSAVKSLYRR